MGFGGGPTTGRGLRPSTPKKEPIVPPARRRDGQEDDGRMRGQDSRIVDAARIGASEGPEGSTIAFLKCEDRSWGERLKGKRRATDRLVQGQDIVDTRMSRYPSE